MTSLGTRAQPCALVLEYEAVDGNTRGDTGCATDLVHQQEQSVRSCIMPVYREPFLASRLESATLIFTSHQQFSPSMLVGKFRKESQV